MSADFDALDPFDAMAAGEEDEDEQKPKAKKGRRTSSRRPKPPQQQASSGGEVMEIEINRADFRGILRELRTLKNVVIDSIADGLRELTDAHFDEFGYEREPETDAKLGKALKASYSERPLSQLKNVKQEMVEEEDDDQTMMDQSESYFDESFEPFSGKPEPEPDDCKRPKPLKPEKQDDPDYKYKLKKAPRSAIVAAGHGKKGKDHFKNGFPLRKYGYTPTVPTLNCRVVLHALSEEPLATLTTSDGSRGEREERRQAVMRIKRHQESWLRIYRHYATKLVQVDKAFNPLKIPKELGKVVKSKTCEKCEGEVKFSTANLDAMDNHLETVHGQVIGNIVPCPEEGCQATVRRRSLKWHVDKVHRGMSDEEALGVPNLPKSFVYLKPRRPCEMCIREKKDPVFTTGSEFVLRRHMERQHNVVRQKVKCEEEGCNRMVILDRMPFHLRNFHGKGKEKHLKCPVCGFATGHLTTLRAHCRNLHPEQDVDLPVSKFAEINARYRKPDENRPEMSWSEYMEHLKKKREEGGGDDSNEPKPKLTFPKSVVCEQCGVVASSARLLRLHIQRVHLNIRPYPCELCPKKFMKPYDLASHVRRRHEGKKELICDECSYQCSTKYELKAHKVTIHGGEWNFKCSYPNCKFGSHQEKKLAKHIDSVHKKLVEWKCPHCPKLSSEKGNVMCHIRQVHRGIRRFTCNLCQYGAEKRNRIITHMSLDHNVTVKVVDRELVCEQQDAITVYSTDHDPDFKAFSDSIVRLAAPIPASEAPIINDDQSTAD